MGQIPPLGLAEEETLGQAAKKKVRMCQQACVLPKGLEGFPNLSRWRSLRSQLAFAKLELTQGQERGWRCRGVPLRTAKGKEGADGEKEEQDKSDKGSSGCVRRSWEE